MELYKYRDNKEAFVNYIKNNKESEKMDSESWDILGKVTNSPKLISKLKNKAEESKEEKGKVRRALQEYYNDGIAEGKADSVIELLSELGEVSKELSDKVYAQKDLDILKS